MKLLEILVNHAKGIGMVMVVLGFVLTPFVVGIPILVVGLLVSVFGFYREWVVKIIPKEVRQKIGSDIEKSYQPYHPAINSLKTEVGEMAKIAIKVFIIVLIIIAIYFLK